MAVMTFPDYRELYEAERALIAGLLVEKGELRQTLRDQFAMAALTGLIANNFKTCDSFTPVSARAYELADAMMAARKD